MATVRLTVVTPMDGIGIRLVCKSQVSWRSCAITRPEIDGSFAPIGDIPGVAELPILLLCKSPEKNSRINRDFRDNKLVATSFVALDKAA